MTHVWTKDAYAREYQHARREADDAHRNNDGAASTGWSMRAHQVAAHAAKTLGFGSPDEAAIALRAAKA